MDNYLVIVCCGVRKLPTNMHNMRRNRHSTTKIR
jgi:hypothetical protein